MNEYIVAEIHKSWENQQTANGNLLSQEFEIVIEVNRQRGYVLHSFQLSSYTKENLLGETIIAVFKYNPTFNAN